LPLTSCKLNFTYSKNVA